MKRIISLTESELMNVVKTILEQVNLNDYIAEDFVEVSLHYFRPWIKQTHGEEIGQYPLSFLIKKYLDEFCEDKHIDLGSTYYANNYNKLAAVGKSIVKKGLHELPSMKPKGLFTEKYKKGITALLDRLDIPDYMELKITEPEPYNVKIKTYIKFESLLKSENKLGSSSVITNKLKQYFQDYLGVIYGLASHGELNLYIDDTPVYLGQDEWVKNVFNKELKKKIKELPEAKSVLRSIKLDVSPYLYATIKLGFNGSSRWNSQREFKVKVIDLLKEMGYNTSILKVE